VVKYVQLAVEVIKQISNQGNLPIIVGGTGMYINALLFGYSQIPSISPEIRQHTRKLHAEVGQTEFFKQLTILDPLAQNNLNILDKQRSLRAFEVFMQTNQSIFTFQAVKGLSPLPEFDFKVFSLCPERSFLYLTCNERLKKIFSQGAIDEIKMIKNNLGNTNTPKARAIGIQEIMAYLDNRISLSEAIDLAQNKTRQYAKRQVTWFKNQIKDKVTLEYSSHEEFKELIAKSVEFATRLGSAKPVSGR
jgi:tRNA dimethylallyltransferase